MLMIIKQYIAPELPISITTAITATGQQLKDLLKEASEVENPDEAIYYVEYAETIILALQGQIHATMAIRKASK